MSTFADSPFAIPARTSCARRFGSCSRYCSMLRRVTERRVKDPRSPALSLVRISIITLPVPQIPLRDPPGKCALPHPPSSLHSIDWREGDGGQAAGDQGPGAGRRGEAAAARGDVHVTLRRHDAPASSGLGDRYPSQDATCMSSALFSWVTPLMELGNQRPLEHDDLYLLDPANRAHEVATEFRRPGASSAARPSPAWPGRWPRASAARSPRPGCSSSCTTRCSSWAPC